MKTYFASPERAEKEELSHQLDTLTKDPIFETLLTQIGGIVAILNSHRQVLSINTQFLEILNIKDPSELLGLRLGEALECKYSDLEEAGCGTSKLCATCGAAIAMVACQSQKKPVELQCHIQQRKSELTLKVRANVIKSQEEEYILILAQDISKEQYLTNLERIFFHDIGNIIQSLTGRCYLLAKSSPDKAPALTDDIIKLSNRLRSELQIQQLLKKNQHTSYQTSLSNIDMDQLFEEVKLAFNNHPASFGKELIISNLASTTKLTSDYSLLLRILINMIINGIEASHSGDSIKISLTHEGNDLQFSIWNKAAISEENQHRIFEKNFTTKKESSGHGLGCFSMKLFGEKCLHGKVGFESTPEAGTTFWIKLPATTPKAN